MDIQRADIILVHSNKKFFGSIIHFIMKVFQKDPVVFQHVMLVENSCSIIEAEWRICSSSIEDALDGVDHYKVLRYKRLTEDDKDKIFELAEKLKGLDYSILRIMLQFLDQLFHTDYFSNLYADNKSQICSSLVAWVFYVVKGIKFNNVSWRSCDPDDIDDESLLNSDDWIIVAEK